MTRKYLALYLLVSWTCFIQSTPLPAQQPKKKEVLTRIEQLEKRVADLEQIIKQTKAKEQPKSTSEIKLVGNWAVHEEDRQTEGICTDLRLKDDGTGKAVLRQTDGRWNNVKYDLVGRLQLTEERGNSSFTLNGWLKSVDESQLILEFLIGGKLRQVKYSRE